MCKRFFIATHRIKCFLHLYIVFAIVLFNSGSRLLKCFVVCIDISVFTISIIYLVNLIIEYLCPYKQQSDTTVDFQD